MTCAAFALLTRIHERYLYLAVAALAPFVGERRFRLALGILSLFLFMNVHWVYVFNSHNAHPPGTAWTIQPVYDAIFGTSTNASERKVLSLIVATACVAIASLGWRWLDTSVATPEADPAVAEGIESGLPHVRALWDRS